MELPSTLPIELVALTNSAARETALPADAGPSGCEIALDSSSFASCLELLAPPLPNGEMLPSAGKGLPDSLVGTELSAPRASEQTSGAVAAPMLALFVAAGLLPGAVPPTAAASPAAPAPAGAPVPPLPSGSAIAAPSAPLAPLAAQTPVGGTQAEAAVASATAGDGLEARFLPATPVPRDAPVPRAEPLATAGSGAALASEPARSLAPLADSIPATGGAAADVAVPRAAAAVVAATEARATTRASLERARGASNVTVAPATGQASPASSAATPDAALAPSAAALSLHFSEAALGDRAGPVTIELAPAETSLAPLAGAQSSATAPTAVVAAAPSAPSLDLRSPNWQETFVHRIQLLVDQRVGEAHIKLNPPELGALDVKIALVEDKTFVQLTAVHATARDELAQSLPRLRELFAASGLELGGASVHGGRGGYSGHDGGGAARSPSGYSDQVALLSEPAPARVERRGAGVIDVFA